MKIYEGFREDIKRLDEYVPVMSAEEMKRVLKIPMRRIDKLDSGENAFGPSPRVAENLSRITEVEYYPDPKYGLLREALSRYSGTDKSGIVVTNGADELIDLLMRAVINDGDTVIDCPPTFSVYAFYARLNKATVKSVTRKNDYSLDMEGVMREVRRGAKAIFLCSPNNPTGTVTPLEDVKKLLDTGVLVLLDEAYIEYGGDTTAGLLPDYGNLVILRTFSKWAGIAGLRLGYGLMGKEFASQLTKIKPPYNVNSAAVAAGLACLTDGTYRSDSVKRIKAERNRLYEAFTKMKDLDVSSPNGNFIFFTGTDKTVSKIRQAMEKNRIYLRYYGLGKGRLGVRMTVGRPDQNGRVLKVMEKTL